MGTAYATLRVNEVVMLLHRVQSSTPEWTYFQESDPTEFKRVVYWCLNSADSPLEWRRDGKPMYRHVIEWRTRAGGWSTSTAGPPVTGETGRRGRIRFRKPREST